MVRTSIMAEEELLRQINQIAYALGKSKAAVMREALSEYVERIQQTVYAENPLLGIVGIAGDAGEETDLSNGKDELFLKESWSEHFERNR